MSERLAALRVLRGYRRLAACDSSGKSIGTSGRNEGILQSHCAKVESVNLRIPVSCE
jgi:hypothetical protein